METLGLSRQPGKEIADEDIDGFDVQFQIGPLQGPLPAVPEEGRRRGAVQFRGYFSSLLGTFEAARENILRDYRLHFGLEPDQIFDWDLGEDRRKPSPYALQEIMRLYDLRPDELLMVDDLKPGYDMAHACGVPFACAGWSHDDPEIRAFLRRFSDFYLETVQELEPLLFGA